MYEVARDEEKKNKLIQGIVEKKDNESLIKNYEIFCANTKSTIQTNLDDLFQLQANIDALTTVISFLSFSCFSCFCSNFEISSLSFSYCFNSSFEKLLPCWESLILF
jgi:hypothetical protein